MQATRAPSAAPAADPISQFFAELDRPGHLATFEGQSATLRFDVPGLDARIQNWYVTIRDGDVSVTRQRAPADAVISIGREPAAAMVTGRLNAQAAILRGLLTVEGSMAACMMFQRCLPSPPGSVGRVAPISSQKVTAQHQPTRSARRQK
ncbi:MAG: SCP2 sterol-binding domain-containing protein [Actinobacteria bacterium]|nr:SCP2 sterol-binding domain-containing protein [Actinomycetota bacterium]